MRMLYVYRFERGQMQQLEIEAWDEGARRPLVAMAWLGGSVLFHAVVDGAWRSARGAVDAASGEIRWEMGEWTTGLVDRFGPEIDELLELHARELPTGEYRI